MIDVDPVSKRISGDDMFKYKYNVRFSDTANGEFIPENDVLVQNDSVSLDSICFRPDYKAKSINLRWELFARNIHTIGNLTIDLKPKFESRSNSKFIDDAGTRKKRTRILPKIEFN